jgi:hypothetical protein
MVAIPLLFELRTIFGWWLGDTSEEAIVYTRLIIIYMVCFSMHNPVTTIVQSTGNVRAYSLIVDSIILMCVPATWVSFRLGATSETCVVLMVAVCVVAHLVRLLILHRLYPQFCYRLYLYGTVLPGMVSAALTATVVMLVHNEIVPSIIRVVTVFAISSVVLLLTFYVIGLSREERGLVRDFISRRISKRLYNVN